MAPIMHQDEDCNTICNCHNCVCRFYRKGNVLAETRKSMTTQFEYRSTKLLALRVCSNVSTEVLL